MQARTNLANKQTTAGRNTQTRDDCKFSYQNKYRALQKMDYCHSFCDENRYTTQGVNGCN